MARQIAHIPKLFSSVPICNMQQNAPEKHPSHGSEYQAYGLHDIEDSCPAAAGLSQLQRKMRHDPLGI